MKWKQEIILFDLDGTLTDSAEGVFRCTRYMQEKMGMRLWTDEELRFMIGPPLQETFRKEFALSEADTKTALAYFRERYFQVGMFENKVYDGVREMLSALKNKGKRLGVATSKHEWAAVRILEHYGLLDYFELVGGDNVEENRTNKQEVMAYVLNKMGAAKDNAVMVGDRMYDIDGGRALGISTIGVEYGYGDRAELIAHKADCVVKTPMELVSLFR